jgi:uncharacterized protein (TIGR02391 family)
VNLHWSIEQLTIWLTLVDKYRGAVDNLERPVMSEAEAELLLHQPVIEAIVTASGYRMVKLITISRSGYIDHLERAGVVNLIGFLQRKQEIENNLATPAPRLHADRMHSWVWKAAQTLWETKHYRQAVQAAATSVNAHVQQIVGRRDVSDTALMQQVFSEKDPEQGKPRLRWPGEPNDLSVRSMNEGLRGLAVGCFQGIRNIATHDATEEPPENEALEQLATLSLLARWIEACHVLSGDA